MHSLLAPVVGLLIALTWTDVAAQQSACTLLTSSDIRSVTGATPQEPRNADVTISEGPAKGQNMLGCTWITSEQGMVTVGLIRALSGPSRAAGLASLARAFEALRAQHWSEEKKDFSNGSCSRLTPPASQTDVPIVSGCFAEARGMVLSVGFMSPTRKLSINQTKALLDKAIGRLP